MAQLCESCGALAPTCGRCDQTWLYRRAGYDSCRASEYGSNSNPGMSPGTVPAPTHGLPPGMNSRVPPVSILCIMTPVMIPGITPVMDPGDEPLGSWHDSR